MDLRIPAGETVAIVGPNGSGKSTLASLVLRFYDPQDGSIWIDGLDLRQVRVRDLRGQIGLVTQDPVLFNDTVEANIRVGQPHATRDQVVQAARRAQADGFIRQELPQGYQTVVGEGAGRLSGGQKQRIALARAILRDPRILVLDEATSQVDLKSERQIHRVLANFIRGRTTLIITHRLSILPLSGSDRCDGTRSHRGQRNLRRTGGPSRRVPASVSSRTPPRRLIAIRPFVATTPSGIADLWLMLIWCLVRWDGMGMMIPLHRLFRCG